MWESIDVDRSEGIASDQIARKAAPPLMARKADGKDQGESPQGGRLCSSKQRIEVLVVS
jgi:hypothetical protein